MSHNPRLGHFWQDGKIIILFKVNMNRISSNSADFPIFATGLETATMNQQSLQFLKELLETPSPSGNEGAIQKVVRSWAGKFADQVWSDRHGNLIALKKGATGSKSKPAPKFMMAGHCDQIALMVLHIDENGFLYVQPIGGWDMQILLGQHLTVWGVNGPVPGVLSRKATHLLTNEERNKVPQFVDVWVDIGAKDKKEAEGLVTIGDGVTVTLGFRPLRNELAAAPSMDDKVGVWTVMEALRLVHRKKPSADLYFVSTVQEEVGLRGATTSAQGILPQAGVAVDVCHATDTPGNDRKLVGEVKLGSGPVLHRGPNFHPAVFEKMSKVAKDHGIPIQLRGIPKGSGTDANAMQLVGEGVAMGLIGIPNRYMHSPVEVVSLTDLVLAAQLLAEFSLSLQGDESWILE